MNNKILKKIIFFLIILVITTLISIICIKNYINNSNNKDLGTGSDVLQEYGKNASGGIDEQSYFDVKKYMQNYIDTINISNTQYGYYDKQNNYVKKLEDNEIRQKIYNLLSYKFINEKNISIENLYDHIKVLKKSATFVPVEIALIQDGDIKSFLVYGLAQSVDDYNLTDKIIAVVNIDFSEFRFSIEPIYGDYTSISQIIIEQFEDKIIANEDNEYNRAVVQPEDYPNEYINLYKVLAIGAPEKLYNLLDEDYRNKKFTNLDEFKNYIKKHKSDIITARLEEYKIDFIDEEKRYICIDQNENYYIINQKEFMYDYSIMLDTYTKDLKEFIDKYESSDNKIKVALNIEKLIEATKMKDYKYIYSKLDERFKNNNFKTLTDFENFIKGKFDSKEDNITYKKYEEITGIHIYNIEVPNKKGEVITAKIVMELKDERDFSFSFSVNN